MNKNREFLRLPVVSHGAEFLVQGYLMRRNILTYKAPPNNDGYDLICIHPDPRRKTKPVRIQVKSRCATDSDRSLIVKEKTFGAFDFLIAVFLNIGNFFSRKTLSAVEGRQSPEFYTFPINFVRKHHNKASSWEKVRLKHLNIEPYKNDRGFDLIAKVLRIEYPAKPRSKKRTT